MNAGDAPQAAEFIKRSCPVSDELARFLPGFLKQLILEETLSGVIVEYIRDTDSLPEFAAFGLSGFISEACAIDYLASPTPHFELALLERAFRDNQEPAFLDFKDVAQANAGAGLTLFPLLWLQITDNPADPEAHVLLGLGQQSLLHRHRGYKLARILKEVPLGRAAAFTGGGFKEHRRIPAGTPLSFNPKVALQEDHLVFIVTRSDIEANWPGTAIGQLFAYQPPRCAFTRAEQQVLIRAADGLTDAKIAQVLGISAVAVSLRWRSIYTRLMGYAPFALRVEEGCNGGRGREKRRLAIAFVNEHSEELRPYERPRRNSKIVE